MEKSKKRETLTGEALLKNVKKLGNLSKQEKATACGYYTATKSGVKRVNMMKFLNALIDAEGIQLNGSQQESIHRGESSLNYRISVQANGNLIIGSAYTKQMGLSPGDKFEISLGRKHIHLRQLDREEMQESEGELTFRDDARTATK
ncbi:MULTISPECIES: AbrB family transcriptional regulator [Cyanophyceae]|uniref:AbrB family transcriptional regulator n=1 Tax=Cyanophyceae TaxID=3028117 RepID=UPI0016882A25|nr:AbrB family transcriptional regulator [Trichocoleus sp. FACHB-40]MBD2001625.1 AbrB family transcriptional regulator [Trichocoleus sp. FACHB-40]